MVKLFLTCVENSKALLIPPLTPLGIQQAKTVKPFLDDLPFQFDHAYSSSSERACDTLEIVTNLPYIRLKGLKEWNFGILEGEPEYLHPPFDQYDEYFLYT